MHLKRTDHHRIYETIPKVGKVFGEKKLIKAINQIISGQAYHHYLCRNARKPVFRGLRTTQAQMGHGFDPHRRHCNVVLEQDTFILA